MNKRRASWSNEDLPAFCAGGPRLRCKRDLNQATRKFCITLASSPDITPGLIKMTSRMTLNSALAATVALVSACANPLVQPMSPPSAEPESTAASAPEPGPGPGAATPRCSGQRTLASVETYKIGVARHILRANLGYTFDGHLPPMLPAIVVLRLSVDQAGILTDVLVQRSRDITASQIAMASVRRSGTLPVPCGLIYNSNGTLTFSETFLFNGQYQFQLRSLADPQ